MLRDIELGGAGGDEQEPHQQEDEADRDGESQNGQTQILKGISVGERVVGDGSLFLQFANSLQH